MKGRSEEGRTRKYEERNRKRGKGGENGKAEEREERPKRDSAAKSRTHCEEEIKPN